MENNFVSPESSQEPSQVEGAILSTKKSSSTGKIIVIIVAVVVMIFLIIYGCLYWYGYKKRQQLVKYSEIAAEAYVNKKYDKSIEYWQKLIDEGPARSDAGGYLGLAYVYADPEFSRKNKDNYVKAWSYCKKAIQADPKIKNNKAYETCNILADYQNKFSQ